MAFGERGENARLLLRTVRGTFDFAGRSRRTEVLFYWLACLVVGIAAGLFQVVLLDSNAESPADILVRLLLFIPVPALLIRRLHDQDRSGWWALLLPVSIAASAADKLLLAREFGNPSRAVQDSFNPLGVSSGLLGLAVLVLFLLPPKDGPNRYGPDPRGVE